MILIPGKQTVCFFLSVIAGGAEAATRMLAFSQLSRLRGAEYLYNENHHACGYLHYSDRGRV